MNSQLNPKKVLILARDFPPYASSLGSVIRMLKLAAFLQEKGMLVFVVAAGGEPVSYFGYENQVKQLNAHYVTDRFQRYCTRKWARRLHHRRMLESPPRSFSLPTRISKWLVALGAQLFVPDPGILYVRSLADAAERVIKKEGIRNVIVTSPPHSTQLAGCLLKQRFDARINYILDYRDSWNTLGIFVRRGPITGPLSRALEARALRVADHITYQSAPVLPKLNTMFFDVSNKAVLMMNGYDPEMAAISPAPRPPCAHIRCGYFGALTDSPTSYRDPSTLFDAIAASRLPIKMELYGDIDLRSDWKRRLGLALEIHGPLPHGQALAQMKAMDILVLIHSQREGSDEVVPGKLFEYMLAGRPILVVGPRDMEAARIVVDHRIGYVADPFQIEELKRALEQIVADWTKSLLPEVNVNRLNKFSRPTQYSALLPLLA